MKKSFLSFVLAITGTAALGVTPQIKPGPDKPIIVVMTYHEIKSASSTNSAYGGEFFNFSRTKDFHSIFQTNIYGQSVMQSYSGTASDSDNESDSGDLESAYGWSSTNFGVYFDRATFDGGAASYYTNSIDSSEQITVLPDEDLYEFGSGDGAPAQWIYHYFAKNVHHSYVNGDGTAVDMKVDAHTEMKLLTGGKARVNRLNLIQLQCLATEYDDPSTNADVGLLGDPFFAPWVGISNTAINPSRLLALNRQVGSDSNLWAVLPDNAAQDLNLSAPGIQHYNATATPTKYQLFTYTLNAALADTNRSRTNLGVGEQVNIGFYPTPPVSLNWKTSAGGINYTSGVGTTLTAPSNATPNVTVTAIIGGATATFHPFNVVEPSGVIATITSTTGEAIPNRVAGAYMHLNVVMQPTTVSFYKLQMLEIGEDASSVTGYFTNHWPIAHDTSAGANTEHPVDQNNLIDIANGMDTCTYYGSSYMPWPWSPGGSFTWHIPAVWSVGSGPTNSLPWSDQVFSLDAHGAMTITKFDQSVNRTPRNVITPNLP